MRTLTDGLGCFPFDYETHLPQSNCRPRVPVFGVWLSSVGDLPPTSSSALPPAHEKYDASPKTISARTSYLQVRLAFHPYPHLIRALCNVHRFDPPRNFTPASVWTWIAHLVSGLLPATHSPYSDSLSLRLRLSHLNLATDRNSLAHSPIGTPSPGQGIPASGSDCL